MMLEVWLKERYSKQCVTSLVTLYELDHCLTGVSVDGAGATSSNDN